MQNEEFEKIIDKMPQAVREIFESPEYYAKFTAIGEKNGLNVEQTGDLMTEVVLVMAGLTHPENFLEELRDTESLPKEKILEIAKDVEEQIFAPIKQELIKNYENDTEYFEEEDIESSEREGILKEIEDPVQKTPDVNIKPSAIGVLDEKLSVPVKIPKENKEVEDEEGKADWKQPLDPYREEPK